MAQSPRKSKGRRLASSRSGIGRVVWCTVHSPTANEASEFKPHQPQNKLAPLGPAELQLLPLRAH